MLIIAAVVGALTAYYFGLRAGAWAAGAAAVLNLIAMFLPRYAIPIHLVTAAGAFAIWQIGSRRPRPPDAVLAVRYARRAVKRAMDSLGAGARKR